MEFQVFHNYRRLVRRGMAKPLNCQYCDNEQAVVLGPDDEPALKCYYCNVLTLPGLAMYNRLKAVVDEHFVNGQTTESI